MKKIKNERPRALENLIPTILECVEKGNYRHTLHAIARQDERCIDLPDVLYVLKTTGYHEKAKTTFDDCFQTWKYAIRGKTLDHFDIRIIIAFDEEEMLIITVMYVSKD